MRNVLFLVFVAFGAAAALMLSPNSRLGAQPEAPTAIKGDSCMTCKKAYLGGGCFWCMEAVFERLQGVHAVTSGYAGGTTAEPGYYDVSAGNTGHAEVIEIEYDPEVISYSDILYVFFHLHDPTTLNRQGADSGEQYRSIVLTTNGNEEMLAREAMNRVEAEKLWRDPIVTQVVPLTKFYPAEAEHQDYYQRNSSKPYCSLVIAPKIRKLEKEFAERLKAPSHP